MDQVGVNAPGRPTKMTFLSLQNSATLYFLGGKLRCKSTFGIMSPTEAKYLAGNARGQERVLAAPKKARAERGLRSMVIFERESGTLGGTI